MDKGTLLNGRNIETERDSNDGKEILIGQLDVGDKKRPAANQEDTHNPQGSHEFQQVAKQVCMSHDGEGDGDATVIMSDTSSHREQEKKIPHKPNAATMTTDLEEHNDENGTKDVNDIEIQKDHEEKCSEPEYFSALQTQITVDPIGAADTYET